MKAIETREEFHHYVDVMEQLDRRTERGESLTPEEHALRKLLEHLIQEYDDKIELPYSPPYPTVLYLLERQGYARSTYCGFLDRVASLPKSSMVSGKSVKRMRANSRSSFICR